MKTKYVIFCIFCAFLGQTNVKSQEKHLLLKVDSLFSLADKNSKQLEISRQKITANIKNTEIEKQEAYLPELGAGVSVGYISNAHVWDNHFNYEQTVKMPHTSMDFNLAAAYTVFNGGKTKNNLAKAKLEEQIAALDYKKNKEDIQFLLLAKYLDLYTYYNQKEIYNQNIKLANKRLNNITKLVEQGMLTHNDVVRSQLQLSQLELQLTEIKNNIKIVNHDLNVVIGLDENTIIDVDTTLYNKPFEADNLEGNNSEILEIELAKQKMELAEKQIKIVKSAQFPEISFYASDAVGRPFLNAMPPVDIYMHYAQVGVKLRYNITSLYTSKKKIEKAEIDLEMAQNLKDFEEQKSNIEIHKANVKMDEARDKYNTLEHSYNLAKDNYRVIEQKYLNKFSTITDMLDASTELLSAELNLNNSSIAIIYQWFNKMKVTGNWMEISQL